MLLRSSGSRRLCYCFFELSRTSASRLDEDESKRTSLRNKPASGNRAGSAVRVWTTFPAKLSLGGAWEEEEQEQCRWVRGERPNFPAPTLSEDLGWLLRFSSFRTGTNAGEPYVTCREDFVAAPLASVLQRRLASIESFWLRSWNVLIVAWVASEIEYQKLRTELRRRSLEGSPDSERSSFSCKKG